MQGSESPTKEENKQWIGKEEEGSQDGFYQLKICLEIHREDIDKWKGPDNDGDHQRDLDCSSEAVPQRPGNDQIPVIQGRDIKNHNCVHIVNSGVTVTFPEQHTP